MVTLPVPDRFGYACASIDAYIRQTHPTKELVIIANGGTAEARRRLTAHVAGLGRADIRLIIPPGELPLGTLRNISVAEAAGDFVCQWDDDDLFHPERLQRQLAALRAGGHDGLLLQDVLQYVPRLASLYWTHWGNTDSGGHPGTLLARKAAGISYPDTRLAEDSAVSLRLRAENRLGYLPEAPYLFIYVSHGANSWNAAHHQNLIRGLAIPPPALRAREASLRAGLAPFAFPPAHVQVSGPHGPAFLL